MSQSTTKIQNSGGTGCLVRGLYFVFIGWWFGLIWVLAAWFLNLTIIGLPLGLAMINSIPQVMTMRPVRVQTTVIVKDGAPVIRQTAIQQYPFLLRALFFLLVGFWVSFVWMLLAWIFLVFTFGLAMPLSFWMFDRVPAITTLARS